MSRNDWAVFGCRMIALCLGVFDVIRATRIPSEIGSYRTLYVGVPITWSIVGSVGALVAELLAAILLWTLAQKLVETVFGYEEEPTPDAAALASAGIFLLGITILLTRLPSMVGYLNYLQPLPPRMARAGGLFDQLRLNHQSPWPLIILEAAHIAVALSLINGGKPLARLLLIAASRRPACASVQEEI